jgi:transposase InsO family protein
MTDNIVHFYNPLRRQNSLQHLTPDEFEALPSDDNQARTLITVGQ